jgi:hypothetical protein
MAYDLDLELRIDTALDRLGKQVSKRPMFGGLAYFVATENMAFAIIGEELLLRVNRSETVALLKQPGVHTAAMGDREMKGWLMAGGPAIEDEKLQGLLAIGYQYALSLPPKRE